MGSVADLGTDGRAGCARGNDHGAGRSCEWELGRVDDSWIRRSSCASRNKTAWWRAGRLWEDAARVRAAGRVSVSSGSAATCTAACSTCKNRSATQRSETPVTPSTTSSPTRSLPRTSARNGTSGSTYRSSTSTSSIQPTSAGRVAPVDYSNAGLGDINLLCTRKLGRINALALTGILGLPTGAYDAKFKPSTPPINQTQQIGFGRPTATLSLDQTLDEVWGLAVLGGLASWRGGTNDIHNYRAPSATGYGYVGYFLGPLVPAIGLSATGYTGHDKDQDDPMRTPLFSLAANLSLEWSTDWIAFIVAASIPYGYDGIKTDDSGLPRSPWGFLPWTVSFGIAASPF